jgi:hypothetical protein
MTFTITKQRDQDLGCIPVCAAAALAHAGQRSPTEAELITHMYPSGFDLLNRAMVNLNLPCFKIEKGVDLATRLRQLAGSGTPVLVAVSVTGGGAHCVVVTSVSGDLAMVHDPGIGQVTAVRMSVLEQQWCGDIAYLAA